MRVSLCGGGYRRLGRVLHDRCKLRRWSDLVYGYWVMVSGRVVVGVLCVRADTTCFTTLKMYIVRVNHVDYRGFDWSCLRTKTRSISETFPLNITVD